MGPNRLHHRWSPVRTTYCAAPCVGNSHNIYCLFPAPPAHRLPSLPHRPQIHPHLGFTVHAPFGVVLGFHPAGRSQHLVAMLCRAQGLKLLGYRNQSDL